MAHTLTARWYESSTSNYVTVNGIKVDVPYELKNGDIIRIYTTNGDGASMFLNGREIAGIAWTTIDLSNTDIMYNETGWGPTMPGDESGPIITINYTETASISFKHFFRNSPIGSGTIRFRPYTVAEPLPQLATVSNVSVDGTTVSWDEVENATSYEVRADGESIGTVEGQPILITFTIGGTSYQAEEGMTWGEWVESSYNTISSTVAPDGKITFPPNGVGNYIGLTDNSDNDKVVSTDIIIAQMQYYGQNSGGQ